MRRRPRSVHRVYGDDEYLAERDYLDDELDLGDDLNARAEPDADRADSGRDRRADQSGHLGAAGPRTRSAHRRWLAGGALAAVALAALALAAAGGRRSVGVIAPPRSPRAQATFAAAALAPPRAPRPRVAAPPRPRPKPRHRLRAARAGVTVNVAPRAAPPPTVSPPAPLPSAAAQAFDEFSFER